MYVHWGKKCKKNPTVSVCACVIVTYSQHFERILVFYYCKSWSAGFLQLSKGQQIRTVGGGLALAQTSRKHHSQGQPQMLIKGQSQVAE